MASDGLPHPLKPSYVLREANVCNATSPALVGQLNAQLNLAPPRRAHVRGPALAPHAAPEAKILDDWELGCVLDALRPPYSYLDWCSVAGVDQFAEMLVEDVRSVGSSGRSPVRRFVALANGLQDGQVVPLGSAHWIAVVYDVEPRQLRVGGDGDGKRQRVDM